MLLDPAHRPRPTHAFKPEGRPRFHRGTVYFTDSGDVVSEGEAEAQSQVWAEGLVPVTKDVLWFLLFLPYSFSQPVVPHVSPPRFILHRVSGWSKRVRLPWQPLPPHLSLPKALNRWTRLRRGLSGKEAASFQGSEGQEDGV